MFTFRFGQNLKVHTASSFNNKNGDQGFVIILTEDENQPEGLERPSRSKNQIKIWGTGAMPEGLHNGCTIQIMGCEGFDWKHLPRKNRMTGDVICDRYGNTIYDSHIELITPEVHIVDTVEKSKKGSKKAEG